MVTDCVLTVIRIATVRRLATCRRLRGQSRHVDHWSKDRQRRVHRVQRGAQNRQPTRLRQEWASHATGERVFDSQNDDGPNDGDEHAPEVEPGHARCTNQVEKESANDGANDPKNDVEKDSSTRSVDEFAGDET